MAKNNGTDSLWGCVVTGVMTAGIGVAFAALGWTEDVDLMVYVGWAAVALGSTLLLIGSVGWGVLLGLRARDAER